MDGLALRSCLQGGGWGCVGGVGARVGRGWERAEVLPPSCPALLLYCWRPAVHVAEEVLSYTSITILAVFNAELLAKLLVFGFKYFTHSRQAPNTSRTNDKAARLWLQVLKVLGFKHFPHSWQVA